MGYDKRAPEEALGGKGKLTGMELVVTGGCWAADVGMWTELTWWWPALINLVMVEMALGAGTGRVLMDSDGPARMALVVVSLRPLVTGLVGRWGWGAVRGVAQAFLPAFKTSPSVHALLLPRLHWLALGAPVGCLS